MCDTKSKKQQPPRVLLLELPISRVLARLKLENQLKTDYSASGYVEAAAAVRGTKKQSRLVIAAILIANRAK